MIEMIKKIGSDSKGAKWIIADEKERFTVVTVPEEITISKIASAVEAMGPKVSAHYVGEALKRRW